MCDKKRYFAFGYDGNNEINRLLGLVDKVPAALGSYEPKWEDVTLPHQFMIGRKFHAQVLQRDGIKAIAYIDVDAWPLAL